MNPILNRRRETIRRGHNYGGNSENQSRRMPLSKVTIRRNDMELVYKLSGLAASFFLCCDGRGCVRDLQWGN